jgi:hypothetical protein
VPQVLELIQRDSPNKRLDSIRILPILEGYEGGLSNSSMCIRACEVSLSDFVVEEF